MRFEAGFDVFYDKCLLELKARANYTDAFLPMLDRYVTITSKLSKLNMELVDEEMTVQHTNKAGATNDATSPKWRMFLALDEQANKLAKILELTPGTAPVSKAEKPKGAERFIKKAV